MHGNPMRRIRRTLLTGPTEALKKYLRTRGPPLEAAEALGPGAGAGVADDASAVVAAGAGHALDVEGAKDYFGAAALGAGGVELGVVAREARSSGRIDLAGRGLHTLPTAALAHAHLDECTHSLDVASNALADIDPALADALPSLRALHASNNRIARLPLALAGMARVQVLDLDQNKLTDDSFAPFDQGKWARAPPWMWRVRSLTPHRLVAPTSPRTTGPGPTRRAPQRQRAHHPPSLRVCLHRCVRSAHLLLPLPKSPARSPQGCAPHQSWRKCMRA